MEENSANKKQTIFHGGVQYLERIDEIAKALDLITVKRETPHSNNEQLRLWTQNYALLNSLFKELFPKMSKEEKQEHRAGKKTLKKIFNDQKENFLRGNKVNLLFLDMFDEWELRLRSIAEDRGLTMPNKRSMLDATDW